jgi:hypothetical protein
MVRPGFRRDAGSFVFFVPLLFSEEPRMQKTETGAAEAPRNNTASDIETLIERWWEEHFPGSPVARVTEAWNHALAAKAELKRRLADFTSDL